MKTAEIKRVDWFNFNSAAVLFCSQKKIVGLVRSRGLKSLLAAALGFEPQTGRGPVAG